MAASRKVGFSQNVNFRTKKNRSQSISMIEPSNLAWRYLNTFLRDLMFYFFDFLPKFWEIRGSKTEIWHFQKLIKFARRRQTPYFLKNRDENQKTKTWDLLGTYQCTLIPNLKVPSFILIDFYSFESKKTLFWINRPFWRAAAGI